MEKPETKQWKRLKGMTMTELLAVLAIMGILVLLAYPVLSPLFQKARSTEAVNQLKHLCNLEQNYFNVHSRYGKELKAISFQQAALNDGTDQGGTANYRIEVVEVSKTTFRGRATAVVDFDGDGVFNVWEVDETCNPREIVED